MIGYYFIFSFIDAQFYRYNWFVAAATMSAIYEENKDEDGFLYMTYSGENTFGTFWRQKNKRSYKWCKLSFSRVDGLFMCAYVDPKISA